MFDIGVKILKAIVKALKFFRPKINWGVLSRRRPKKIWGVIGLS